MNNINIKKMKLYILQKRYSEICNSIKHIQDHIIILSNINFIDTSDKNIILSTLFEISKNINSKYNEFINDSIGIIDSEVSEDKNTNIIFNNLDSFEKCFENYNCFEIDEKPLDEFIEIINEIIEKYGFGNLFDTLRNYVGNIRFELIEQTDFKFLKEVNELVLTTSIEIIDTSDKDVNFGESNNKIEIPDTFNENDYLELTRYLFLKYNKNSIILDL